MSFAIGVVGATGLVGVAFLEHLEKRKFPVKDLRLFASDKSVGQTMKFKGKDYPVTTLGPNAFENLDIVFFSSGDQISLDWAPLAKEAGAVVIDNSAAFRMNPKNSLVVPEINSHLLGDKKPQIIANPNCSTIQLVMCLHPLHKSFGLKDVRVATYQSVSGAGRAAVSELKEETAAILTGKDFTTKEFLHPIAFNTIPQIGSLGTDGFCSEEAKIINETKKILGLPNLLVSAFTVRTPTTSGHGEAAWVTLEKSATKEDVVSALEKMPGVKVHRDSYPMVRFESGNEFVHVGRIHKDASLPNTWLMWIVSDSILKGAAVNGIQIAEAIFCR